MPPAGANVSSQLPEYADGLLAGFAAGSQIAGYHLEEQIGAGGMAVVFRARDDRLGRVVALKLLAPALAADIAFRRRFIGESHAAAAVDDPHIIPVYEAGEAAGVLFIAMRYVRGGDVRSLVQLQGALAPVRAVAIISPVASALDAAHAVGLVHRDVKPANMLLDSRPGRPDHVYLSDFGLSKGTASTGLTATGQFMGTPNYIAPEQIEGHQVDGRMDQYALACAAFEMLTGTAPFERDQGMAVLWAHLSEPPPSISARQPGLDSRADEVFAKALAKKPEDRFSSCQEFADALRASLGLAPYDTGPRPIPPPPPAADEPPPPAPSADEPPPPAPAADEQESHHPETELAGPEAAVTVGRARAADITAPTVAVPDAETRLVAEPPSYPYPRDSASLADAGHPQRSRRGRNSLAAGGGIVVLAAAGIGAAIALSGSPGHAPTSDHGKAKRTPTAAHSAAAPPAGLIATSPLPGFSNSAVTLSSDGTALAAFAADGSVTVWNASTGHKISSMSDPQGVGAFGGVDPNDVAFDPGDTYVAAGDQNGHAYVWDVASGHQVTAVIDPNTLTGVAAVAFGPGGSTLATGDGNGHAYIWRVRSGSRIATVSTSSSSAAVAAAAFSPDGATLAVGDSSGVTTLWAIPGGARIRAITDPNTSGVNVIAFSPGGTELAVADGNGSTYLWNASSGQLLFTLTNPNSTANGGVTAIGFSHDGAMLATADGNGNVYVWRVSTGAKIGLVTDPSSAGINAVAFNASDKHLATTDANGNSYLWKVPS
jgi:serine/threonine protein kinase/WD40 repeat protein